MNQEARLTEKAAKVLETLRARYVEVGFMYDGATGPEHLCRLTGLDGEDVWAALAELVDAGLARLRGSVAVSFGLTGAERVRLIEERGLATDWQTRAPYFYPNEPHGEVSSAYRAAAAEAATAGRVENRFAAAALVSE